MRLNPHLHLAYCTNIHRGENWSETFAGLKAHTLRVKEAVCSGAPYAIGLRLSAEAAHELSQPKTLLGFQKWLDSHQCYVFTINGFPYGRFHGAKVKEQVYRPDWTTAERLNYTNLLFDLLAEIAPEESGGSVSTCPASFKEFGVDEAGEKQMRLHLRDCAAHIERLSEKTGKDLHLGLEPEPLCYVETSVETVDFIQRVIDDSPNDDAMLKRRLGINYDCCHLAVEFEEANDALGRIRAAGIRMSKIHLSSALKLKPTQEWLGKLRAFEEDIYLHQVVERQADGTLRRYRDLTPALDEAEANPEGVGEEWRVHFHIPLHHEPTQGLLSTSDHLMDTLEFLAAAEPNFCSHLEMETYTWEVLPQEWRREDVVDQLVKEYEWCLEKLTARGLIQ